MSSLAKTLRSKYERWALGSKGPSILIEAAGRIERLEKALRDIRKLESKPIADTGFSTGPLALLLQAKRIAKDALSNAVVGAPPETNR